MLPEISLAIYGYFLLALGCILPLTSMNFSSAMQFNGWCGLYQNLDLDLEHLRLAESLAGAASSFDELKQVVL